MSCRAITVVAWAGSTVWMEPQAATTNGAIELDDGSGGRSAPPGHADDQQGASKLLCHLLLPCTPLPSAAGDEPMSAGCGCP